MHRMWAIVPIKQFEIAKKRLADVLRSDERVALARAMLRDVLRALTTSPAIEGVVIVSREPAVAPIAEEFRALVLAEDGHELSLAVGQGARHIAARGRDTIMIVPGDVPLLTATEVDRLAGAHAKGRALTLVSDRDGTGTNGLVATPVDLIDFHYGANSFQAHAEAAAAAGVTATTVVLEGLSLDIDTPDDLRELIRYRVPAASLDYLHSIDVVSRIPARHNVGQAVVG